MKAAQLDRYGGKDTVKIHSYVEIPKPTSREVLVEVYAAGVNPFDLTVREGRARQMKELELPATLGGDVSGIVAEDSGGLKKGQEVYGQANALGGCGSFAEYTPVKASQLAVKPTCIDFRQAASLPLVASSAYQALVDHMHLQKDQKILIHGGAGGIGSMAIQLAKYLGAYVATTAAADDINFVKSLGADEVIDYKTQDFAKLIRNYDAVYDTIGGETNRRSYQVIKPGGSLVSMISQPDEALVNKGDIKYTAQFTYVTSERLGKIAELVDGGHLKPILDKTFPLEQAAEALEYLKSQHTRGKVIIQVK